MTQPSTTEGGSPYSALVDAEELAALEAAVPGGASLVLGMIKSDMEWIAERHRTQDTRDHQARMWALVITMFVVLAIAAMATYVIRLNHGFAGGVLATVDLVALATAFLNGWRR